MRFQHNHTYKDAIMRKLFLTLILLYSTFLYAEIDERKSDVYFPRSTSPEVECIHQQ